MITWDVLYLTGWVATILGVACRECYMLTVKPLARGATQQWQHAATLDVVFSDSGNHM